MLLQLRKYNYLYMLIQGNTISWKRASKIYLYVNTRKYNYPIYSVNTFHKNKAGKERVKHKLNQ